MRKRLENRELYKDDQEDTEHLKGLAELKQEQSGVNIEIQRMWHLGTINYQSANMLILTKF